MNTQQDLFASSPRPKKAGRVVATSAIAGQAVNRDRRIAEAAYVVSMWPNSTSAELTKRATCCKTPNTDDLLFFRRGLSDALALGLVEHAGQRKCAVSGRTCVVWRLKQR